MTSPVPGPTPSPHHGSTGAASGQSYPAPSMPPVAYGPPSMAPTQPAQP